MEHNKNSIHQAKAFGFYYSVSDICSTSTWGSCSVNAYYSFALSANVEGKKMPVDFPSCLIYQTVKSPLISLTHLVHVTGPLHDVLERSLACDIVHQEDSLKSDRRRFKKQMRMCSFSTLENLQKRHTKTNILIFFFFEFVKMPCVVQYFIKQTRWPLVACKSDAFYIVCCCLDEEICLNALKYQNRSSILVFQFHYQFLGKQKTQFQHIKPLVQPKAKKHYTATSEWWWRRLLFFWQDGKQQHPLKEVRGEYST